MKLPAVLIGSVALIANTAIAGTTHEMIRTGLVQTGSIQEETRWQGWVPSGQVVEINNVRGNVRAEAAESDEIEVIALKRGDGDPEQVAIQVVEHKGGVTICAVYPDVNRQHPFDCRPSHGGGFLTASTFGSEAHIRWGNGGGGDVLLNDLRVDFVVRLPKRLRFIGRTIDGEVSAHMIDEDVEAHSVHGDVRVGMGAFQGAEVRAETTDGEVRSEFPLAMHCDPTRGRLAYGHVGRSHHVLHLTTVAGDIHLERVVPIL
jgi:hypothetical protein